MVKWSSAFDMVNQFNCFKYFDQEAILDYIQNSKKTFIFINVLLLSRKSSRSFSKTIESTTGRIHD